MDYEKIFDELRCRSIRVLEDRLRAQESGDFFKILQLEVELNECRYELLRFTCEKSYLPADIQFLKQLGLKDDPIPEEHIRHKFCDCLSLKQPPHTGETSERTEIEPLKEEQSVDVTSAEDECEAVEPLRQDAEDSCKTISVEPEDVDAVKQLENEVVSLSLASRESSEEKPCASTSKGKHHHKHGPLHPRTKIRSDEKNSSDERSQRCEKSKELVSYDGGTTLLELPTSQLSTRKAKSTKSINHVLRSLRVDRRTHYHGGGVIERRIMKLVRQAPSRRAARLIRYTFESFGSRTRETDILDVHCMLRLMSEPAPH